jgi:hypothetical protein
MVARRKQASLSVANHGTKTAPKLHRLSHPRKSNSLAPSSGGSGRTPGDIAEHGAWRYEQGTRAETRPSAPA